MKNEVKGFLCFSLLIIAIVIEVLLVYYMPLHIWGIIHLLLLFAGWPITLLMDDKSE